MGRISDPNPPLHVRKLLLIYPNLLLDYKINHLLFSLTVLESDQWALLPDLAPLPEDRRALDHWENEIKRVIEEYAKKLSKET